MTIPSSFLFELPLDELDSSAEAWMDTLTDTGAVRAQDSHETDHDEHPGDDSFDFGALADQGHIGEEAPPDVAPRPVGPAWHGKSLRTAAELLGEAGPNTAIDPSTPSYPDRASVAAAGSTASGLNTAAELFSELTPAPRVPADDFYQGMLVRHPEYGLGKIVALSGGGPRRTATVAFASGVGQKKFVVGQSTLRPAKGA
jgi:hypothetical protein